MKYRKGRIALIAALATVAGLEIAGIIGDTDTISQLTADIADVLPGGRGTFLGLLAAVAAWFGWHIWTFGKRSK